MVSKFPGVDNLDGEILFVGLSGSHAYGLAHENSDEDWRGCFITSSENCLGLASPPDQYVRDEPDITLFEARKFLNLALQGNPNVLEVFHLPQYDQTTVLGADLLSLRPHVLSNQSRERYLGFAGRQIKKILSGRYNLENDHRRVKAIRHGFRLMWQAQKMLSTGVLDVKVPPHRIEELHELSVIEDNDEVAAKFEQEVEKVMSIDSVLPEKPNFRAVNEWLVQTRKIMIG